MSSNIIYRGLCDIKAKRLSGISIPDEYKVSDNAAEIIVNNPRNENRDVPVQKLGVVGGKIGGAAYSFPTEIRIGEKLVKACSGGELFVAEWARRSGLGFDLCDFDKDGRDGDHVIFEGAGLSQIAVKVHRFMGYKVFEYPRYIMLLKSRSLLEMKLRGVLKVIGIKLVDVAINVYALLIRAVSLLSGVGTSIIEVEPDDGEQLMVLGMLATQHQHRFSEVHDFRWFKWVLNNSFSKDGPAKAYLMFKQEQPIGFFVVKKRFHEQASHRGFKNVWLGSIIEWGCLPGCEKKLLWTIVAWTMRSRKKLDAVEFPVYEPFVQRFLRRLGWQHVGDANFCYNIRPDSGFVAPEGMDDPANWHLRPAMGDVGLN